MVHTPLSSWQLSQSVRQSCGQPQSRQRVQAKPRVGRFRVLTYNVGGLSTDTYDEFMVWASSTQCLRDCEALVLTETRRKSYQEFETPGWYCISTGASSDKSAGVLILVRRIFCSGPLLQSCVVVPGRVLHVRIPVPLNH